MIPASHYHIPVPSLPTLPSYPSSSAHPHTHIGHFHPALPHTHPTASTTYIPSLIPPGMDAAHVDMRAFCPYTPNERKHRNRTTRPQLRVLEDVYTRETKPNANLRRKLAAELGMTPRGVQVWFQNRRAKMKNLAKKALAAQQAQESPQTGDGEQAETSGPCGAASPPEEEEEEEDDEVEEIEGPSASQDPPSPTSSSKDTTPRAAAPAGETLHLDTENDQGSSPSADLRRPSPEVHVRDLRSESAPVQNSTPVIPPPVPRFPSQPEMQAHPRVHDIADVPEAYLLAQRRPSLPTYAHAHAAALQLQQEHLHHPHSTSLQFSRPSYGEHGFSQSHPATPGMATSPTYAQQRSPQSDALLHPMAPGLLGRRRSAVDPHTHNHATRLSGHPYAPMVAQRNSDICPRSNRYTRHYSLGGVPPIAGQVGGVYVAARDVAAPPPGPLPAPDFCFGAPPPSEPVGLPHGMERSISQPPVMHTSMPAPELYPVKAEDHFGGDINGQDTYRDGITFHQIPEFRVPEAPNTMYGSRFGSFGAESDVSSSGAFFSDASSGEEMVSISRRGSVASVGFDRRASLGGEEGRRGSFVSTNMAEMFSGLDVSNPHSSPSSQAPSRRPSFAHLPQLREGGEPFSNALESVPPLRRQRSSLAYGMHASPSKLSHGFSYELEQTNQFSPDSADPSDSAVTFAGFSFQHAAPADTVECSPYEIPPGPVVSTSIAASQPGYPAVSSDVPVTSTSMEQSYPAPSYPQSGLSNLYPFQLGVPSGQEHPESQQHQLYRPEQHVLQAYQNPGDGQLGGTFGSHMLESGIDVQNPHMHLPVDGMQSLTSYMLH